MVRCLRISRFHFEQPLLGIDSPPREHRRRQLRLVVGQLDQARDHLGARVQMSELTLEPVGGGGGVRVCGGDQPPWHAECVEPLRSRIHAKPPRGPGPRPGPLQDIQLEPEHAREVAGDAFGLVHAGVGNHQGLKSGLGNRLPGQRLDARADPVCLVAGRHDDDAHECHDAPCAISSAPRS